MSTDEEIGARLRTAREAAGYKSAAAAAEALRMAYPTYAGHENGSRGLKKNLERYAQFFRVSVDWLLRAKGAGPGESITSVPIVGKAGAAPDGTVMFARGDGNLGAAEAPFYANAETRALEVEGESMRGIADDGSLIFYDEREAPNDTHVGELCICWLEDERVMIKYPYRGAGGLWSLESTTAATLRDVSIRWFAHVTSIVPRRTARQIVRKHVDLEIEDTTISK